LREVELVTARPPDPVAKNREYAGQSLGPGERNRPRAGHPRAPRALQERPPRARDADVGGDLHGLGRRGNTHRAPLVATRKVAQVKPEVVGEAERARELEPADTLGHVHGQLVGTQRGSQRGQDHQQARRRVGRGESVGERVQPGELAVGRRLELVPRQHRDHVVRVPMGGVDLADDASLAQDQDPTRKPEQLFDIV
jgi:hypothetical protein